VTALRQARGEAEAREWLLAMKNNGTRVYPNNIAIVQAVAAHEIDLGLVNHYYLHPFILEQGASFKARNHFFTNGDIGALVNVAGAGVLNSASNVEDAQRFIEYLLSHDAQVYFAEETFEYPLIEGVEPSGDVPPLASLQPPPVDLNGIDDLEGTLKLLQDTGVLP
jgi:iron(III) transport system substrate-binding protein